MLHAEFFSSGFVISFCFHVVLHTRNTRNAERDRGANGFGQLSTSRAGLNKGLGRLGEVPAGRAVPGRRPAAPSQQMKPPGRVLWLFSPACHRLSWRASRPPLSSSPRGHPPPPPPPPPLARRRPASRRLTTPRGRNSVSSAKSSGASTAPTGSRRRRSSAMRSRLPWSTRASLRASRQRRSRRARCWSRNGNACRKLSGITRRSAAESRTSRRPARRGSSSSRPRRRPKL